VIYLIRSKKLHTKDKDIIMLNSIHTRYIHKTNTQTCNKQMAFAAKPKLDSENKTNIGTNILKNYRNWAASLKYKYSHCYYTGRYRKSPMSIKNLFFFILKKI